MPRNSRSRSRSRSPHRRHRDNHRAERGSGHDNTSSSRHDRRDHDRHAGRDRNRDRDRDRDHGRDRDSTSRRGRDRGGSDRRGSARDNDGRGRHHGGGYGGHGRNRDFRDGRGNHRHERGPGDRDGRGVRWSGDVRDNERRHDSHRRSSKAGVDSEVDPDRNSGVIPADSASDEDLGEIDMRTEEEIAEEARRLRRERMKRHAAIMAKHKDTKPTPAVEPATSAAAAPVAAAPVEDGITDEHPMYKVSSSGPPPDVPKRTRQQGRGADNVLDALPQSSFDMFDVDQLEVTEEEKKQAAATVRGTGDDRREVANALNKAGTMGNMDDWDDHEGYYKPTVGELILNRYKVLAVRGRGVFSTVVFCRDTSPVPTREGIVPPSVVAIKIIRNNDVMRKAADKEMELLRAMTTADKGDRHHIVRLFNSFEFRNHICMVFEALHMDLNEVLAKFGAGVGIRIDAVRMYTKQLLLSLRLLEKLGIVHADIKPHNIVCSQNWSVIKLCDFGSAFRYEIDNDPTPYLVSRFYRAPEVILGLRHSPAVDMWSVACVLFELYTGKVLFAGDDNNDMLWRMMQVKGRFPNRVLRRHFAAAETLLMEPHFTEDMAFIRHIIDKVSGKPARRIHNISNPTKDLTSTVQASRQAGEDKKPVNQFGNLLEKMLMLDPAKRITVKQALQHPFLAAPETKKEAPLAPGMG